MKKPTYYYRIGKSNWYHRIDSKGKEVKVQKSRVEIIRRNKIIKGVRKYYIGVAVKKKKPESIPLWDDCFQVERPSETATLEIFIADKKGQVGVIREDVEPEKYYIRLAKHFKFYYEEAKEGRLFYRVKKLPQAIRRKPHVKKTKTKIRKVRR